MPLLRITHQRGALTDAQKAQLAEELTSAILMAELGADTPAGRALAYVLFDEVDPKTSWFVGGKPDTSPPKGGRFLFDIVYPVGGSMQADKTELHAAINRIVANTLDVDGSFPNRAGDWAFVHEVPNGSWGAGGQTIGIREINRFAGGGPERSGYFEQLLAAQERIREAHGFPSEVSRANPPLNNP
ncbi:tautomerase family protein [Janthinobacterium sp.]|uniref:tautomerase family protein n=1 Tax=Janthinobacterium sp. TaxID=1871054 RepID=UPI00293D4F96|nr:tautomerase family protein [Janthinobacterium sp.]